MKLSAPLAVNVLLGALACAAAAGPAAAQVRGPNSSAFPYNVSFTLERINGKPLPSGIRPTLNVSSELRASGHSGCNSFSAVTHAVPDGRMRVGPVALTRMACAGPVMQIENSYLRIYYTARRWSGSADAITVRGAGGTLSFRRGI